MVDAKDITDAYVRGLSIAKREVLLAHIDGAMPVDRRNGLYQTTGLLMEAGLLRGSTLGPNPRHRTDRRWPRATVLTDGGRHAVAKILAAYADALTKVAEVEEGLAPAELLRRLGASARPKPAR